MIRVIIADDQPIIRKGLKLILELDNDMELVAEGENGKDLIEILTKITCDIILMDIRMPDMDGVEATLKIKEKLNNIKVLILTTFEDDEYIFNGLRNGADGYLLKDADPDEIIRAIKTVCKGDTYLHPRIATKVVSALNTPPPIEEKNQNDLSMLTTREKEVANLVAMGKGNREIGEELFITEGTVKNHVSKILDKLELKSRDEIIVYMTKVMGK
ncbi:response regulator [Clostridium hydrogenum]|uniref:response regulator n=1 Tax=Clostridium hydrogenum TaxID=2855764 RepID=UPI001F1992B8|nr:response regulator transcription factor [Clostridium hydrogenum]